MNGDFYEGYIALKQCKEKCRDLIVQNNFSVCLWNMHKFKEAYRILKSIGILYPQNSVLLYNTILIEMRMSKFQKALSKFHYFDNLLHKGIKTINKQRNKKTQKQNKPENASGIASDISSLDNLTVLEALEKQNILKGKFPDINLNVKSVLRLKAISLLLCGNIKKSLNEYFKWRKLSGKPDFDEENEEKEKINQDETNSETSSDEDSSSELEKIEFEYTKSRKTSGETKDLSPIIEYQNSAEFKKRKLKRDEKPPQMNLNLICASESGTPMSQDGKSKRISLEFLEGKPKKSAQKPRHASSMESTLKSELPITLDCLTPEETKYPQTNKSVDLFLRRSTFLQDTSTPKSTLFKYTNSLKLNKSFNFETNLNRTNTNTSSFHNPHTPHTEHGEHGDSKTLKPNVNSKFKKKPSVDENGNLSISFNQIRDIRRKSINIRLGIDRIFQNKRKSGQAKQLSNRNKQNNLPPPVDMDKVLGLKYGNFCFFLCWIVLE